MCPVWSGATVPLNVSASPAWTVLAETSAVRTFLTPSYSTADF